MRDFQNKKQKSLWYSLPVLIGLFVLLIFFVFGLVDFARKSYDAYLNRKNAEERIFELTERKKTLQGDLEELHTDLGKERIFRENYGLGRPGEGVIVVVDEDQEMPERPKPSVWGYVKDLFTN